MLCLTLPWLFQRSLHGLSGVGTLSVMTVIVTAISLTFVCIGKLADGDGASEAKGNAPDYGFSSVTSSEVLEDEFLEGLPAWFK